MSTTDSPATASCAYCDGPRDPHDSVRGSYCSEACYFREKGEGLIDQVETDRRICATCFGHVREIERVPGRATFEYRTEKTVYGIDGFPIADSATLELRGTRWSCACGAVDPGDYHPELQALDRDDARRNLAHALVDLYRRDAIAHPPDPEAFFDAFRAPWRGARYAVGRAVYGDGGSA